MSYKIVKRILDIFFALIFIVLSIPLQLIIFFVLFIVLKENPIFLQTRGLTHNKFRFVIIKFKTISSKEIRTEQHLHSRDIFLLPNLAIKLNKFEKWLRKTGLDELPQIYNVLVGQMSFIGPRPLMLRDLAILKNEYPDHYKLRENISVKPGISGIWQIIGDRALGVENLIALDIFYNEKISLKLDFNIILATIPIVLFARNSDAIIPRVNIIDKLLSSSIGDISFSKKNFLFGRNILNEEFQNYSVSIPNNWWYRNDIYSEYNRYKKIDFDISRSKEYNRKSS